MPFLMLIRGLPSPEYIEVTGEPHSGFQPWGITHTGALIFASKSIPLPPDSSPFSLKQKDANQNLSRRTEFETALALLLRTKPMLYMDAVRKVSRVIDEWIGLRLAEEPASTSRPSSPSSSDDEDDETLPGVIADVIKDYMYARPQGDRYLGMMGSQQEAPRGQVLIDAARQVLSNGFNLDQQLNFHRTFVTHLVDNASITDRRKELNKGPDPLLERFEKVRTHIQPNAKYVPTTINQRVNKPGAAPLSSGSGILSNPQIQPGGVTLDAHTRALDKYGRPSTGAIQHPFEVNADKHGMPFVGGPSASAADLFICAAVAGLNPAEMERYALAVIAFMVGGGMHSFHEIMKSAKKSTKNPGGNPRAGIAYVSGKYESALPQALLEDPSYKALRKQYPDIVDSLANITNLQYPSSAYVYKPE